MTIAQQLKIKEFPFFIKDNRGKEIYYENSDGYWWKKEYDSNNNRIYYEDSYGLWCKKEYDSAGNEIYCEDSNGYWWKKEYGSTGYIIYFENSKGVVRDYRPKPVTELTNDYVPEKKFTKLQMVQFAEHCMRSLLSDKTTTYNEISYVDLQRITETIKKFL